MPKPYFWKIGQDFININNIINIAFCYETQTSCTIHLIDGRKMRFIETNIEYGDILRYLRSQ